MGFAYLSGCIFFTVYGQLIIKWRIGRFGALPDSASDKFLFLVQVLLDPFIISGLVASFLAGIFWMATMTKLDLSLAYPFMSLPFIFVLLFSALFFNEPMNLYKVSGMALIIAGVVVSSRGLSQ